jgi:[ribosomal protein S5]-alanine N-acetyltransferase
MGFLKSALTRIAPNAFDFCHNPFKNDMEFETLTTEPLELRKLTPEVYHSAFSQMCEDELKEFFGFDNLKQLSRKRQQYQQGVATYNRSFLYFQLLPKENRKIIGWCGFHTWYTQHRRAEIGYGITDEANRRNGYMHESIHPILHFGFAHMNLHRVEAFVGPGNQPSLNLLKKIGFVHEGVLRHHY